MKNIKCIVFDLDGTLVNSAENIYQAMIQTFEELKVDAHISREDFVKTIGWHFEDIFDEFGISIDSFDEFISIYKDLYFKNIHYSELYPGVRGTIDYLHKSGFMIALLTTKNQDQADMIIDHFGFREQFNYVMGRRPGIAHKPSPEPLLKISTELNISPETILMVGDSEMDVQCGRNAGSKTCAVTYGYRSKEALVSEYPDIIVDNIGDLEKVLAS